MMPEDLYGALTCLNIMDCVRRVVEGSGADNMMWVYLNIPFISKNIMETLARVESVVGILPIEDEIIAISCWK